MTYRDFSCTPWTLEEQINSDLKHQSSEEGHDGFIAFLVKKGIYTLEQIENK